MKTANYLTSIKGRRKSLKNNLKLFFSAFVLSLLLFPCLAYSFSLEEIKIKSSFGEKFYAEVIVNNEAKKGLEVSIGSPTDYSLLGTKRSKIVDELHITKPIEFVSYNQQVIKIVSEKPLFFPSFDLIIKVKLAGGTIIEKYSLAADFKKNMSLSLSPLKPKEKTVLEKDERKEAKRGLEEQKAEEKIAKSKVKKRFVPPDPFEDMPVSVHTETLTEKLQTYTVVLGDTLSSILKKIRPQKTDFYKAVVALWKLNKEDFLDENINGLKVGSQLSFDKLDEEIRKTKGRETTQTLRDHGNQWKSLRSGVDDNEGKTEPVHIVPLPGEQEMVSNDVIEILSDWRQSWEEKDLERHLSYYSDDFMSQNYNKENIDIKGWKEYKSRITKKNKNIKIDVKSLHIRTEGDKIIASFLQKFSSDNLISFGTKTISFSKKNNQWKIKKEQFKKHNSEIVLKKYPYVVSTSFYTDWKLAINESNRLRDAGFSAYLVKAHVPGKGMGFWVVIDRFRSRRDANKLAERLVEGKLSEKASALNLPYAISVGSFKDKAEVLKTLQVFREKKYSPYLFSVLEEDELTHYVLVGGYKNKKQADRVSEILERKGVTHQVIQP